MAMSEARPAFNFDRDFSKAMQSPYIDSSARVPVAYAQYVQDVEAARREGFERGILEGRRRQEDAEARRLAEALEMIQAAFGRMAEEIAEAARQSRQEAIEFALIFARKLAGRMIKAAPIEAIEATARAIFQDLRGSAHLAVRVAPDLVDPCKARLMRVLSENGIEIKLFVFPDPEVAIGDCRIEWAEGGIVRERAKLDFLIEKSIDMLIPARAS